MLSPNKRVGSLSFATRVFSSYVSYNKQEFSLQYRNFSFCSGSLETGYSCSASRVYYSRQNPDGWYKDQKLKNFHLLLLFANAPILDKKIWLKQLGRVKQIWLKSNHICLVEALMTCISTLIYFAQPCYLISIFHE